MKLVLDDASVTRSPSWREWPRAVAQAEFENVELPFSSQASLTPETGCRECLDIRRLFHDTGVSITALRFDVEAGCHVAAPQSQTRCEAIRLVAGSLQRCEWLGAEVLSVPVSSPRPSDQGAVETDYADTLALTATSLSELVPAAEEHGVRLALEVPAETFLTSPVETAELIDRINSPWVGVRLDVDRALEVGLLSDWLSNLGWRLAALRLSDAAETVEAAESGRLAGLLDRASFTGPVVVSGRTKLWWSDILECRGDGGGVHR